RTGRIDARGRGSAAPARLRRRRAGPHNNVPRHNNGDRHHNHGVRHMKATTMATRTVAALLAVGMVAAAGACSHKGHEEAAGTVTLVVGDFGNFGYKKLIRQYEQEHPTVKVVEKVGEYNEHHENLTKAL